MPKDFKTIDEQLEILKSRGLSIPKNMESVAQKFLLDNNYYRISGYSLTLRNHDVFYPKASIQNLMDIYNFDRELRNIILWAIDIIEVNIKSRFTYFFSQAYTGVGHLDPTHFFDQEKYDYIIKKANKAINNRLDQEDYLQHFVKDLQEPIPLWAYVDLFTISDISQLYSISDDQIKMVIAKEYGLTHNKAAEVLENYLHGITIVRNLCAHGSRLYNRLFIRKPDLNRKELALLNKNKEGNPDNTKLYGYVLIIKRMITEDQFKAFKNKIVCLCNDYSFVDMKYYGFREDWKSVL